MRLRTAFEMVALVCTGRDGLGKFATDEREKKSNGGSKRMKIPTAANIHAAKRIRDTLIWKYTDELLYSQFRRFPRNIDREEVAHKANLVDKLYYTNLKEPMGKIADHIVALNIDPDLLAGNVEVVNKISGFPGKQILSFAGKYCHFSQRDKFPMWDKFAAIGLGDLVGKDHLKGRNYNEFKSDIDTLNSTSGLRLTYKNLDEYLWLYGQKVAKYEDSSTEIKDLSKNIPHIFAQLDPP